jgi:hypothetical protein
MAHVVERRECLQRVGESAVDGERTERLRMPTSPILARRFGYVNKS